MKNETWLFIGDSITDVGRNASPDGLGNGYVKLVHDYLAGKHLADAARIINRGLSGNKITDLQKRWKQDVLDHEPDLLSIKIGINDVWHSLMPEREGVPPDMFEKTYREILSQTTTALPACKIVLCHPSVIWAPAPSQGNAMLGDYIDVVTKLSVEFKLAEPLPLHEIFERAKAQRSDIDWAPDGVHPSPAGHMLIARAWLEKQGLI